MLLDINFTAPKIISMQGKKQHQEKLFQSVQLSERVPEDNIYRLLKKELEPQMQFLYKATKHLYGNTGNPGIDPIVFFKLIIVAYLENIISDRKLVSMSSMRLDILFFLGYDLDETIPVHSTVSRTRQLYPKELFESLFNKVFSMCVQTGMVGGHTQSIDSALVKANASMGSMELKQPQMSVEQFMAQSDEENKLPEKQSPISSSTPLALTPKDTENQEPNEGRKKHYVKRSNQTHYSPSDPDARLKTKTGKPMQLNYQSGMSVDTDHHVISHIQADFADENDDKHLVALIEKTKARLEENELQLENVLADTNFSTGPNYRYLEQENIQGFIPPQAGYKHEIDFIYDEQNDTYTCRNNKVLTYFQFYTNSAGQLKKEYKSTKENCDGCPFRSSCLRKNYRTKKLTITAYRKEFGAAYERINSKKGRRMMRLRQSTVEPVFGSLINYFGMKKVNAKGIEAANKAMLGAAIAYNLKKYLKFNYKKAKCEAKALSKQLCNNGITLLKDLKAFLFENYFELAVMELITS